MQIKLTMEAVALDMLAWDAFSNTWGPRVRKGAEPPAAPVSFQHAAEYVDLFKGLLMQELHAHLVQVCPCFDPGYVHCIQVWYHMPPCLPAQPAVSEDNGSTC